VTPPLRILLVEDSATDAKLVVRELERAGRPVQCERVETAAAMREALGRATFDLVISDWSMPSFTAPAALQILNETQLDLPFIIVSGTIGEEVAVEAMRTGARDFVLKDRLARLAPAVERELREHTERAARRAAEEALRESEARFRRLAESGVIGILTTDLTGHVLDANDAYLKMVGYSREELARGELEWVQMTPPEAVALGERALAELRASGVATPWETETFRKDKSRVPVLVGVATLEHPRCIAFVVDLTGKREAEAGRARAEEALRQSEEQLRHAQKMEAVGRLAGGVAHDFNNVLSVILSHSELIIEDLKATDPMRADVDEIRKAAMRAAGLTRQLLTFSRQHVVQPKVLDLGDVLGTMDKMLQRILGEDIELAAVVPEKRWRVKADPTHLEQVVLNLVVNARDAMPLGGKLTIEIANVVLDEEYASGHLAAKSGPHVMLAVTDTGCGMNKETQRRIFEPFFTTKEVGKGTGLGLSTVFGIVQQSGGNIWVYSEVGKGTTFKVYLPRADGELDARRAYSAPSSPRGRETILLVEDEEQVRTVTLSILRRQGYRVLAAPHPGAALLLAEDHAEAIELLITDVVMPQMSGPELAKRLAGARPAMKVLYMSGYTDDAVVRHGVLEAGVAFLQKPITPASLATKIREVLDGELAAT
jgi:two-component system, cell cycle sensor histidine kinase and response regulator CckA